MKKAIITIGISASGKTTWATQEGTSSGYAVICRDDIRSQLQYAKSKGLKPVEGRLEGISIFGQINPIDWKKWNWKDEDLVNDRFWYSIELLSSANAQPNIIIADTNLHTARRRTMVDKLKHMGFEVTEKWFDISFQEAVQRDAARVSGVGISVIAKQMEQYLQTKREVLGIPHKYVPDCTKPKAVVCDIDGTICTKSPDRSPYDWRKVGLDTPRPEVVDMINGYRAIGYRVVFLSGRDGICRAETVEWLNRHVGGDYDLYMRPNGDGRDDRIVKNEMFTEFVEQHFNVQIVVDDRPKVCDMWRELGLNVAQVANPYVWF